MTGIWKTKTAIAKAVASASRAALWALSLKPTMVVSKTSNGSAAQAVDNHQWCVGS